MTTLAARWDWSDANNTPIRDVLHWRVEDYAASEYLLDLEDAVVAVKDEKGKVKLHQSVNLSADGAVSGGFWSGRLSRVKTRDSVAIGASG